MGKKVKNLYVKLLDREFLEQAADEAIKSQKNKKKRFLKQFIDNRKEYMDRIEEMFKTFSFPKKEYHNRVIDAPDKQREISTLPFYPWSIIFHAVKDLLEPIAKRVLIYDSSAGQKGKGQIFGALRTEMFIRRYKQYTHIVKSDCRKFYQSILHRLVIDTMKRYIGDEKFLKLIEILMFDYFSGIEEILLKETEKKKKYCRWACDLPFKSDKNRGVTIGGCINQLVGNMCLNEIDRYFKQDLGIKFYHRHCDDIIIGAKSQEEGEKLLGILDKKMTKLGLCLKSSSCVAPLTDEEKGIKGRKISFCGFMYSRKNMRMRSSVKRRFARKLSRVKSKRREREIVSAYYGITKWGRCKNLMKTILKQNGIMSFKAIGISTQEQERDANGKKLYNVDKVRIKELASSNRSILIHDFETGVNIGDSQDRCVILFSFCDNQTLKYKTITTSKRIIDKLERFKELVDNGEQNFPIETQIHTVILSGDRHTYDAE